MGNELGGISTDGWMMVNMKLKGFSKNSVDLNSIIKIVNFTILVTTIYIYISKLETNPYFDFTTLVLLCMLSLQVHLILMFERRNRDPFVLLLALNITFFYLLRVLTLAYDPWSGVLTRFSLTVDDINLTLLYIFFGIWAIFFGLSSLKFKIHPINENSSALFQWNKRLTNPFTITLMFIFVLVAVFYFTFFAGIGRITFTNYSKLNAYINVILNPDVLVILSLAYLTTNLKIIQRKYLYIFIILFVIYILFLTIAGSRGGILRVIMAALFVLLSAKNKVSINKSALVLFMLIIIPISIMAFGFATYSRSAISLQEEQQIDIKSFVSSTSSYQIDTDSLKSTSRQVFDRIGFLDMATDKASNSDKYDKVINLEHYMKSSIKVITPGFNLFNVQRAALSTPYIYRNMDIPLIIENYESDQFTIFGEYYVLFKGYGSLIALFAIAYIFKLIYLLLKARDAFSLCFYRAIFLYIFYNFWLNSFGTDWLIIEATHLVLSSIIFMMIARIGEIRLNKSSNAFTNNYIDLQKTIVEAKS